MRSRFLGLVVASVWCGTANAQESQVTFDLAQAKRYAVEHNYGVISLKHEVDAARSRRDRMGSAFLPKLGVAAGAEADATAEKTESGGVGYVYTSVNLFNGYRDVHRSEIGDLEIEKAELKLRSTQFLVGLEVEEFFHLYLFKKTLIDLKEREITLNDEHKEQVKRSRAMGSVSETDVMEFSMKDAALRSELIALKQELEDARSNLRRILGEEIGGKIQPIGMLQHQHVKGDLKDQLTKIEKHTGNVLALSREVAIARIERQVTNGRWLPEVDLEGRFGYLPLIDRIDGNRPQASVALVAKLELYGGRDASYEEREKRATAMKVEAELKDQLNSAIRNVEMGYRNLKVVEARADLEKDNADFARRYYQSVVGEYRRGFKNSSDLSAAAEKWHGAQARKVQLEFEFIRQRVGMEKSLGTSLDVEIVSQEHK